MISGKAIIKGGSIYINEIDITYSKNEILNMSYDEKRELFGFMIKSELERVSTFDDDCLSIVTHIFDSLK